jgi:arsenite-transporting ATPase
MGLLRRDDEVVLTVGPYRRTLRLEAVLRRCRISGAVLRNQALEIRFTPDPAQWPSRPRGEQGAAAPEPPGSGAAPAAAPS